ncbi:hypothetical protein KR032_007151 [Drosophila birchii]|nr:hypothetical protein KR032_007151 [Drosophila birchii]
MSDIFRRNLSLGSPNRPSQFTKNSNNQNTEIKPKRTVSRHVNFTPSTLEHQEYRRNLIHAVPSAFQNFVREMVSGYYELKLIEERQKYGLPADHPLGSRRLPIKDLVHLQIVAKDMWRKMSVECKQRYRQLAKEAAIRKKQRLPPDPYKISPSNRRSGITFQRLKTQMDC